jgi:hypothetical protein
VDQDLLLRNEYLAAENRILKAQLKGRLRLSDAERATLGEIAHRLGRKVLGEVANVARPDTIARSETAAISCMIVTRSSPSPSEQSSHRAGSNHSCCLRAART